VTTFLVYLMASQPYDELFETTRALMESCSHIDFGFHFCICTEAQLQAVPRYVHEMGVSSFKFFMNFRGDEGRYLGIPGNDDGFLFRLLRILADHGGMLCPHAENIEVVWELRKRPNSAGASELRLWYDTRPPFVEAEAIQRVAYLGRVTGTPVYIVHLSSSEALEAAARYRGRHRVYIETCPHYLTHDLNSDVGVLGKVNPPLREPSDREALWEAIDAGLVDVIASDHVPREKSTKAGDVWKASAGFPGTETLLPVMLSEGHVRRSIPLERIVSMLSTNPAKLFGLYPRKGTIAVGADADLVVVRLGDEQRIKASELHSGAGYSIYEGWPVRCVVVHTLVRGQFVVRDGRLVGPAGLGCYQARWRSG
jgi:dihydropyrimidinase